MEDRYQSLAHSRWDCKYHIVFVPKRRRRQLYGQIRRQLGAIFHALARQKECQIVEGHLLPDHVHICIAIPPKTMRGLGREKSARVLRQLHFEEGFMRCDILAYTEPGSRWRWRLRLAALTGLPSR